MGNLKWNSFSGSWSDPAAWSILSGTSSVPGAADDATIDLPYNYVVTLSGAQAVHDLVLNDSGAQVMVAGTLDLTGTLSQQAGLMVLAGGVLHGGTIAAGSGTMLVSDHGTLDGTTWQGALTIVAPGEISGLPGGSGTVEINHGLTLTGAGGVGPGVLALTSLQYRGYAVYVHFNASQSLSGVAININTFAEIDAIGGTTLTIAPNSLLNAGGSGNTVIMTGHVINQGSIRMVGSNLQLGSGFDNEGNISSTNYGLAALNLLNNGTIAVGSVGITGNLSGTGTIEMVPWIGNASLVVTGTIEPGTLILGNHQIFSLTAGAIDPGAVIDGFIAGSTIDLRGVSFTGNVNAFWSGTAARGTLTIKDGTTTKATLTLTGINTGATFSVKSDNGIIPGTVITTTNIACFVAGTRIRTPTGETDIEHLHPGDLVLSAFGGTVPVLWLGYRTLNVSGHPIPKSVWPIRIQAGALSDGLPARDLCVSPEHALLLDGVLIPAGLLVNGVTITQEHRPRITYWHIELPQHDAVLAEGVAAESYLDTGNRTDFANAGLVIAAHPCFSAPDDIWRAQACAPQCRSGPRLAAVRSGIARRWRTQVAADLGLTG